MSMTQLQRAQVARALATLERFPEYAHGNALLRRIAGRKASAEIERAKRELITAKSYAKQTALLSADALAYWREVREAIRLGQLAQSTGDRRLEKRVSLQSERLEERFDERVPDVDKPKFLRSDGDEQTWDERWAYVEFRPPLLRREFSIAQIDRNPANTAQRLVLAELLEEGKEPQNADPLRARGLALIRLARRGD